MNPISLTGCGWRRLAALAAAFTGMVLTTVWAQPTGVSPLNPPPNGPRRGDATWHALVNATVYTRPGMTVENATVVIRDGMIVGVHPGRDGKPVDLPRTAAGARVWDCTGLHIYPGFIDAHVDVDAPVPDANAPGVHWNNRVMPQRWALDGTGVDERTADSLRRLGFTAAAIVPRGGVFRGMGAVVSLARPASDASADRPPVYRERVFQGVAFDSSRRGGRTDEPDVVRWSAYPNSQMGAIALIRQTLIDADWQAEARRAGAAIAFNSIDFLSMSPARVAAAGEQDLGGVSRGTVLLFDTEDELDALRAAKIAREFERPAVILGSGYEFRRLEAIVKDGLPIVLPLRFPRAPDVAGIGRADAVELRDLMTWEQAPTNPRRLDAAGVKVSLTTSKLRNRTEFEANLTRAIRHGLAPERAMAMLTTQPAELLGVADRLGTIDAGKVANLVVSDGPLFVGFSEPREDAAAGEEAEGGDGDRAGEARGEGAARTADRRTRIRDVWVDGIRHEISAAPVHDHVGTWQVIERDGKTLDPAAADALSIIVTRENQVTYRREGRDVRATNVRIQDQRLDYVVEGSAVGVEGVLLETAVIEGDHLHGTTLMTSGEVHRWTAKRGEDAPPAPPTRDAGAERRGPAGRPAPEAAGRDTFAGVWIVTMEDQPDQEVTIEIGADNAVTINIGGQRISGREVLASADSLSFRFDGTPVGVEGAIQVDAARQGETMLGTAEIPGVEVLSFSAAREPQGPAVAEDRPRRGVVGRGAGAGGGAAGTPSRRDAEREERAAIAAIPEKFGYPFGPYMLEEMPEQKATLFVNATLWTASERGIIENGWMFIKDGKIAAMGEGTAPSRFGDVTVVDARGKHIAPGIIDCHSHTGISRGVNESGQAVTAEVRIGDVTNPDAISWYRQLASGVTAVNSLHGSANAIGGQSQTNKIRWGVRHPDDMHMEGAMPGIKFALGENPKQSNWGDRSTTRYPQTRMGVETLIRDRFKAARQYMEARQHAGDLQPVEASGSIGINPVVQWSAARRDLELEALAEVLAGERLVHCHSYRQDEILMLCRIADEFGFRIGTFQHILEGYKVADEVAKHAIGASAFSDWWAYKVEVQDAIPQAGPIMWEEGVVVSFNSDSDELARRMNGEAAKAIKYASPKRPIEPNEALKFVTLNAAIQLGVADRIGSLEVGKDADFAIWSGSPLSSLSRCEATYVDGRRLFSLEDDAKHREVIRRERQRLIQKALAEQQRRPAGSGAPAGAPGGRGREAPPTWADEARMDEIRAHYLDLMNRGYDPEMARPGECGCGMLH